jgi:hypothetical protein
LNAADYGCGIFPSGLSGLTSAATKFFKGALYGWRQERRQMRKSSKKAARNFPPADAVLDNPE